MTQSNENPWAWFTEKVLPALFVGMTMAVSGTLWASYTAVRDLTSEVRYHDKQITEMRTEIVKIKSEMVGRPELSAHYERISEKLEIILLRSGVKNPAIKYREGER